ncbi:MAG TPA: ATP-dependent zinc metalloprotease FtsH [Candidatus Obscuribacterales bacterium]
MPDIAEKKDEQLPDNRTGFMIFAVIWLMLFLPAVVAIVSRADSIPYSQFLNYVNEGKISEVVIAKDHIVGQYKDETGKVRDFQTVPVDDKLSSLLNKHGVKFSKKPDDTFFGTLLAWGLPILLFLLFISFVSKRVQGEGMGQSPFTIGKSRARIYKEEGIKVTFADVAGVDEAKEELKEIISFLKSPDKYRKLGGRLPKGILLVGPPGTGKTLLARAVAGEAGVPFFSISGSEFVELFVGVGAARVRDLFEQAMAKAPCIIFIDELDALGRARGISPMLGTHDEKEQTLNQLLAELDGFDPRTGVILLAATNRPEILDPALLRAGRFDRQVLVGRPDKKGRIEIVNVHLRSVPIDDTVDAEGIAAMTTGFTGADIANLINEAALLAARRNADTVSMSDITSAIERLVAGLEKKNRILNQHETEVVSYHEMGHALVALSVPGSDPIHKVSIIPRGFGALGYTMQRPIEDRFLMTRDELENKMTVLLGGRAAESLVFENLSTGAADDLQKATDIARHMVTRYGMGEGLGMAVYEAETATFLPSQGGGGLLDRRYSEETAREIDVAVRDLIEQAYRRALTILRQNRTSLDRGAQLLARKETITQEELEEIVADETLNRGKGQLKSGAFRSAKSRTQQADGNTPQSSSESSPSDGKKSASHESVAQTAESSATPKNDAQQQSA